MQDTNQFIEKHIVTGLVVSTDFLNEVHPIWDDQLLESPTAKRLSSWCIEYYKKYNRAPQRDIEGIYFDKLKKGNFPKDVAEDIEDIFEDLSEEYEREGFNVEYLLDKTREYFNEKNLERHSDEIKALLDQGELKEADNLANHYQPLKKDLDSDINLSDPNSLKRVEKAFTTQMKPLVTYPGALGKFLNPHLTRDAFVALLAPEKRGKSWVLLDLARRAVRQRLKVAFFQAGDMSEGQQIRRLGIHLLKKSDQEQYCGEQYEPVRDCIYNQLDECDLDIREHDEGLVGEHAPISEEQARGGLSFEQLKELYEAPENKEYKACHNCAKYHESRWGCSWLKKVNVGQPLEADEAVKTFNDYFVAKKRSFMLSTHPNNTLTIGTMKSTLDSWYRRGFVADLIICDYADLLVSNILEFRHKQDDIWKGLRNLSEERHCLVVSATQADAKSYEQGLLKPSNFTEDKRKRGHVTAMFGLNQDPDGKEKKKGVMRINCLDAREGDSNPKDVVYVLQNLKRGQPVLTSYF